jgi:CRISPR-associated endonuclease/helicase Cas3
VPHAIWGAALAYKLFWQRLGDAEHWKEIALPIAGHHTGLHNGGTLASSLDAFLAQNADELDRVARQAVDALAVPKLLPRQLLPTSREFFIRMLLSALVDADRLETERHFQPEQAAKRGGGPSPVELGKALDKRLHRWMADKPDTNVNRIRREVYDACTQAALGPQGVYRLTVPTGGGKTLNGLAFALRHLRAHGLRRVIAAIPYTSIIDQTVEVYRSFLTERAVLEHHSQVAIPDDEAQDDRLIGPRLATENWDAPLIVTTTVQLFESLFGNRPSQVRKLHNLADSVILLDEVQTLPVTLLEPTLDALRALVDQYGVTVVLSTATQPALEDSHYLQPFHGIGIREIVPDYSRHFGELRRVDYELWSQPLSRENLAEEISALSQVMVVFNTRRDAVALLNALDGTSDVFHLSTLLCAAHRRKVLQEVRTRLEDGLPVRLISTQVVEAGVDLDFPSVWRAVGPLDRIVQAAGRCNREGKRPMGRVVIFELVGGGSPRGPYKAGIEEAKVLLRRYGPEALHQPELYREFFRRLFAIVPVDGKKIQSERARLNFPKVAEDYRLIEEDTVPVVVPYEDSFRHLAAWRRKPNRTSWQRLQPYLVNIHGREAERLQEEGWPLKPVTEGLFEWRGEYDVQQHRGLAKVMADPSDLVWIA